MTRESGLNTPELARLDRVLRKAFQESQNGQLITPDAPDQARILSLACGGSLETEVLQNALTDLSGAAEIDFTGVDIRDREISDARRRFATKSRRFLRADASKLENLPDDPVDLVFLRHQNFWHDRALWSRIFDNGLELLKSDGRFVITSYFEKEHKLAVEALKAAGARLVSDIADPHALQLYTPGKAVDRHIAVFTKPV